MYLLTETSPTIVHSPTKYTLQNCPPLPCIFISPSLWDHWLDYKTSKNCILLKLSLDSTFPSKLLPISLLPFITKLLRELPLSSVFTSSSPIFPWAPSHQVLVFITFRQTTVVKTSPGVFAAKPSGISHGLHQKEMCQSLESFNGLNRFSCLMFVCGIKAQGELVHDSTHSLWKKGF